MSEFTYGVPELVAQIRDLDGQVRLLTGQVELTSRVAEQLFRNQHNPHNWNAYTTEREERREAGLPTWQRMRSSDEAYTFYSGGLEIATVEVSPRDGSFGVYYLDAEKSLQPHDSGRSVSLLEAIDLAQSLAQSPTSLS